MSHRYLYSQQISYDGSFQLVRKNKASDEHDVCLSDGAKYWVNQSDYKAHLKANEDTAYAQSTRVGIIESDTRTHTDSYQGSDCNNHRAANDTWVRPTGVAESGCGAVTCARHTVHFPSGTVNYFKGER
jgi:ABC-type molybdate transport system substrate-binding protein